MAIVKQNWLQFTAREAWRLIHAYADNDAEIASMLDDWKTTHVVAALSAFVPDKHILCCLESDANEEPLHTPDVLARIIGECTKEGESVDVDVNVFACLLKRTMRVSVNSEGVTSWHWETTGAFNFIEDAALRTAAINAALRP